MNRLTARDVLPNNLDMFGNHNLKYNIKINSEGRRKTRQIARMRRKFYQEQIVRKS